MQQLIRRRPRRLGRGRAPLGDAASARADLRWGIAGIVCTATVFAAFGVVYVSDFHVHTYSAHLSDAGALRVGDEVRLAGIGVGKVESLVAQSDRVDMRFTVDKDVFVGAQTTLSVRMLTVVGGHYLALTPAGAQPLGDTAIPADRITLPYSLPQVFQDAIRPLGQVDGDVLRKNVAELNTSLSQNPEAFGSTLSAVSAIVDIMNRQNADISRALAMADEYSTALAGAKQVFVDLIEHFRVFETLIENHGLEVQQALSTLARVLSRVDPLSKAWNTSLNTKAQPLADLLGKLDQTGTKLQALIDSVHGLGERLEGLVSPQGLALDQSATTLQGTTVCVPVPGRVC